MKTALCDLLQIEHPIIQAPMAGSTTPELVAAVSNAGALGSHGCAAYRGEKLQTEIFAIKERSNRAFNLNFFVHELLPTPPEAETRMGEMMRPYHDELGLGEVPAAGPLYLPFDEDTLAVVLADPPPVISFHFGLPDEGLLAPLRERGIVILSSATTVSEARWLADHGVDAVIAQGAEAGGHRGTFLAENYRDAMVGTMALVPQVVDAVSCPVIAAGGIADGRGLAAALMLGAAGVQIGTAYLTTDEAGTDATYRRTLQQAGEDETLVTKVYSGRPARGVRNRYANEMADFEEMLPPFPATYKMNSTLRAAAIKAGRNDLSPFWSGQAVGLNRAGSAGDLTQRIVQEAGEVLAQMGAMK